MIRTSRWWVAALVALPLAAGCGGTVGPGGSSVDEIEPLSKAEGWRDGLVEAFNGDHPYALLEIAFDRATAERAWQENVPAGQPEGSGDPDEDGRYGELDDVDFDTHALVVWSSGQSGSCPGWLADVSTDGAGVVELETDQRGRDCTDDYNTYRLVLAVHRDRLPDPTWLPTDEVVVDGRALHWGSLVTDYPAGKDQADDADANGE